MQGRSAEAPAQVVHRRKRIRKLDDDVEKFINSERPEALVYGVLETTAPLRGARLVQTQRAPRELERRRVQPPEQRRERLFVLFLYSGDSFWLLSPAPSIQRHEKAHPPDHLARATALCLTSVHNEHMPHGSWAMSGYAHGPRTSTGGEEVGNGGYYATTRAHEGLQPSSNSSDPSASSIPTSHPRLFRIACDVSATSAMSGKAISARAKDQSWR